MRFISIILDPGRIWSDHAVIDTQRHVAVAKCSDAADADAIAKCLNLQWLAKGGDKPVALIAPTDADIEKAWQESPERVVAV